MTQRATISRITAVGVALGLLLGQLAVAATPAIGTSKTIGVGIATGMEHLALTGKYYLNPKTAVQAFFGSQGHGFGASLDAMLEPLTLYALPGGRLVAGVGGGLEVFSSAGAHDTGVHAVGQLSWQFTDVPIEVAADWRPTYWLAQVPAWTTAFAALRWYF